MSPLISVDNPPAWDAFVLQSRKPHIFQSWAWGELKARSGWTPHRLALDEGGRWVCGVSLLEHQIPRIGRSFFYAPRGPVLSPDTPLDRLHELFLQIRTFAESRRSIFLKMDPDVVDSDDWLSPSLLKAGFLFTASGGNFSGIQPQSVMRLPIEADEETLLKNMDQKARYNIRLGEKKGVVIEQVVEPAGVAEFHKILAITAQRDEFIARPLKYFLDIFEKLGAREQAQFFLARHEGKAIAGALAFRFGPVCWYAYGASSNEQRELMPNHLMQWTMIRWAKEKGCRLYDFRAVPNDPSPEKPLYGLYRFKKGFNAELTRFIGEYDLVFSPWFYRAWVHAWPAFRNIRKWVLQKLK